MATTDRTSQTIQLRDARRLGFAEYGDFEGKPLLFFGGTSSRFLHPPDDTYTRSVGVRLIVVERPGLGLSDFQPQRRLLDFPEDVVQLADALSLDQFSIMGASQGGPYAAACAYKIPDRLVSTTLVSSIAPFTVPGLNKENMLFLKLLPIFSKHAPFLIDVMYALTGGMARRNPAGFVKQMLGSLPPVDRAILNQPDVLAAFTRDVPEIYRQGWKGAAEDAKVVTRPWGFQLEDIRGNVFLWQGEDDPNATPAMARYLASTIPGCVATFVPNAGHLMIYAKWQEIIDQVCDVWKHRTT